VPERPSGLPPGLDPYRTLQVVPEADADVIQAAYRRLAQKFHPDVAPDSEAAARMVDINASWEVLRDPARRAAYDRSRASAERATAARASAGGMPAERASAADGVGAAGGSGPDAGDAVSGDWTSGRSTTGGGYDPATMRAPDGTGAAGPPPGHPSGSVLTFGRYAGWSLGEISRTDVEYLEWLDRASIGRQFRPEIDAILRRLGRRRSERPGESTTRGLYRRR
jgi:curved DNA-binding protein CbpA